MKIQFLQIENPFPKSSTDAILKAPPSVSECNNFKSSFVTCVVKLIY